jgi:Tfp pilus assembly protein PilF
VERPDVYCQNCCSQNSLRDTHCRNCGTRLLLVVFPNSLQYDTNHVPSFYEDHLLERVSLLELRLAQVAEGLRIAMEIIREQGKIIRENHELVKSLNQKLNGANSVPASKNKASKKDRISRIIETIVAGHDSPNVELFTKLLIEAFNLLEKNEEKEAFRMMERAALLSPRNAALLLFAAKTNFLADKYSEAKKYLEKAFEAAPDNSDVHLLLGAIYADEGESEKARLFLSILAENEKTAQLVNIVWGMLAAFEGNWSESVTALKLAAAQADSAELQYLLGCAYFQQQDFTSSLRHFQNTTAADRNYSDAWFMQAVIYGQQRDVAQANDMLANAAELKEAGAQSAEFLRKNVLDLKTALPFQHFQKKNARLLTGGAPRLTRFLKNEVVGAVE